MKIGTIPYQETDIVRGDAADHERPRFPAMQKTHEIEADGYGTIEFMKPEDIPLNRRNFVYRPCAANPHFTELGYCCTEYPFKSAGMDVMDRSDGMSLVRGNNDTVSVGESLGWRTSRCGVAVKEGEAYWEVEVIRGGLPEPFGDGDSSQRRKDVLNTIPHLRIGICKREASLEAPVGCDSYGYAIRDHSLESIHEGDIGQTLAAGSIKPGDRLGFLLKLPSFEEQKQQAQEYTSHRLEALTNHGNGTSSSSELYDHGQNRKRVKKAFSNIEFQKALLEDIDHSNVIRDHIAIRYKNQLFFEATDYIKTTKPEYYSSDKRERQDYYHLSDSYLAVFLNGKPLGRAVEDLKPFLPPFSELQYREKFFFDYWRHGDAPGGDHQNSGAHNKGQLLRNKYVNNGRLGYYPTISCFNGGTAKIVTSRSDLKYYDQVALTNPSVKTLETLYQEQVADDIVWDLVDEVEEEVIGVPVTAHGGGVEVKGEL